MLSDHLLKCPTFEEKLKLSIPPDFSLFFLFCLINLTEDSREVNVQPGRNFVRFNKICLISYNCCNIGSL